MTFPTQFLPDPLRSLVLEGAAALDCDPAYLALPALAAVAGAVGNARVLRLKSTWHEPCVLWTATVGESGSMKSPALRLVMEPVYRRQRRLLQEYGSRRSDYESQFAAWKAQPRAERGEEPEKPEPCVHLYTSDATVEGLCDRLADCPRGLLVAVDELSGWMARLDRYTNGGGDVQHYLSMWGACPLKIDRKTDRRTLYIDRAAVSLTGGIQPGVLAQSLTRQFFDCGLPARFLMAAPAPRPAKWTDRTVSDATLNAVDAMFGELFQYQGEALAGGAIRPGAIDTTPQFLEEFIGCVNVNARKAVEMTGHDAAAWSKMKAYTARLALVHHLIRQAAGEQVDPWVADIEDIKAGIGMVEYFWEECQKIYHRCRETDEERYKRELIELINRLGGRVLVRDLQRHSAAYASAMDAELALQKLVDDAEGAWETVKNEAGGRPSRRFVLCPSPDRESAGVIDIDTTPENLGKSGGCVNTASPGPEEW
jgi:hypothetical protein